MGGVDRREVLPNVTRFEVIDENGRQLVLWDAHVELHYQDDGRTLKVLIAKRKDEVDKSNEYVIS